MIRGSLGLGAAAGLGLAARPASAFQLVTEAEAAASRAQPFPSQMRQVVPGLPVIELRRPSIADPVRCPFAIELRFRASGTARIRPETFVARYGAFGIDITGRLLPHARLSPDGLVAEGVEIPAGEHRVRLEIGDTEGRIGRHLIRVTVA